MNPTLNLVETLDEALEFRRWLGERRDILAIDTETTGLQWWTPNFLRTVQFGDSETGWVLPYHWWGRFLADTIGAIEEPVVYHNAKFDIHALASAGIHHKPGTRIHDTQLMSWLLSPATPHGLKPLSERLLDKTAGCGQRLLDKVKHKNGWDWATVPVDNFAYWAYGATDPVFTHALATKFWAEINQRGFRDAYDMELAMSDLAYRMEVRGMRVDTEYTENTLLKMEFRMEDLMEKLEAYGCTSAYSAAVIHAALQAEDPDWEPSEWTDTGQVKLTKDILSALGESQVAEWVLEYRKLKKITRSYLRNILTSRDGDVLHANIRTLRARTGRMSVTEPALQTIPRGTEVRDCFIPRPGHVLLSADYDQIEFRLLAAFAKDQEAIRQIREGVDFHSYVASVVFGENFTKAQRQIAKNTNFAKAYGAGPGRVAETAGISLDEAEAFMATYEAALPGVTSFLESTGRSVIDGKPAVRLRSGKILPAKASDKEYTLTNYIIQGTAADVLKEAAIRLDKAGLADYMIMPIHDEFLFDVPEDDAEDFHAEVIRVMLDESYGVPLTAGADLLTRWGDKAREAA